MSPAFFFAAQDRMRSLILPVFLFFFASLLTLLGGLSFFPESAYAASETAATAGSPSGAVTPARSVVSSMPVTGATSADAAGTATPATTSIPATGATTEMPAATATTADRFAAMDENADGRLALAEFVKALPQIREEAFASMDADKDGFLSKEEWGTAMSGHSMGMPPANMPPGGMQRGMPGGMKSGMPGGMMGRASTGMSGGMTGGLSGDDAPAVSDAPAASGSSASPGDGNSPAAAGSDIGINADSKAGADAGRKKAPRLILPPKKNTGAE